ncbi:MAG: hypothetical protein IJN22_06815 [Clostridia bacterium]|nr:hypothetical protein [Clostridia bacterium]
MKKLFAITVILLSLLIILGLLLVAFYGTAYQKIGRIIKYANSSDLSLQNYDNLWISYDELNRLKFVDHITDQQTIKCNFDSNFKFRKLLEFEVTCNVVLRVWNIQETGYTLDKKIIGTRNIKFEFKNSQWTIANVEIVGKDVVETSANTSKEFSRVLY